MITGHFYFGKNRTFLLWLDTRYFSLLTFVSTSFNLSPEGKNQYNPPGIKMFTGENHLINAYCPARGLTIIGGSLSAGRPVKKHD